MSTQIVENANSTQQLGSWTVVGAATAHAALADGLDTTYIQLLTRCRLDSQVIVLGFPTPTLPAGAQIVSVGVTARVQSVVYPAPQPQCVHRFRCNRSLNLLQSIAALIEFLVFGHSCPQDPVTATWHDVTLQTFPVNPQGTPWQLSDFATFFYDTGRDDSSGNALRYSAVSLVITYSQQSVINVTAPTGTVTTTCRPTVTWTYTNPDADPQQKFNVAIYTAAQVAAFGFVPFVSAPIQTSGWTNGTDLQWTLSADIVNGSYSAYVQVESVWPGTGDFSSGIDSITWTQSITAAPTAVLNSAVYEPLFNRVKLTFQPASSSPVTTFYRVDSSSDFGLTWDVVRTGLLTPANGMTPVSIYDYEAELNQTSRYRVLAYGTPGSLIQPAAAFSNTIDVIPVCSQVWLKDPLNPTLNTPIRIASVGDAVTRQKAQGVYPVLSDGTSAFKVVVNGPQYGVEGTLQLQFFPAAADYWDQFQALDASGHTLLLQFPTGEQHYIIFGPGAVGVDQVSTYDVSLISNTRRYTFTTVSYTEVAKPAVTS